MLATRAVLWETGHMELNPMLEEVWRTGDELARAAGLEHCRTLVLCSSVNAFGSDRSRDKITSWRGRQPPLAALIRMNKAVKVKVEKLLKLDGRRSFN
jgi:hypothetical protein